MRFPAGPRARALAAAGIYLVLGLAWVLLSDALGERLFAADALARFQSWKAAAFVALSALVVYLAASRPWVRPARAPWPVPLASARTSLVAILARLVLVTALPMAGLFGWHLWTGARGQADQAERAVRATAESVARDLGVFLAGHGAMVQSLAQRPSVASLDPGRCDRLLAELASLGAGVLDVTTFDLRGRRICGGTRGVRRPDARPWLGSLSGLDGVLVGPVERSSNGDAWIFGVAHPLRGPDGEVAGAVELLLPAGLLSQIAAGSPIEAGSVSVIDHAGVVVARDPDPGRYVGQPLAAAQRAALAANGTGRLFRATGLDRVDRMLVSVPVPGTGWIASAGMPADALYAPARQALLRTALVGLVILLLVIWMVLRVTRQVTVPLAALARVAEGAAQGELGERAPRTGAAELVAVADGLNHLLERLPQLQARLAERERGWREQVEKLGRNVPSVVFMFRRDAAGRQTVPYVSEAVRQLMELEPAEVADNGDLTLQRIHPDDQARVAAALERSARELTPVSMAYRVRLPSGRERDVLATAQPEREGDGVLWYGSLTDVTELHQAQRALQRLNVTLEQRIVERTAELRTANAALEAFSYSVAHDLRAPLASIEGFTQAQLEALERGDLARAQSWGARVVANTTRMNALIEGLLALARTGRAAMAEAPVDVGRLVAEVLQELQVPPQAQVSLGALPQVQADPATFRQVWHNLLSNAFKYSAGRAEPRVAVACDEVDGELVFSVADNGAGFEPQWAEGRLFKPFGRLHADTEFPGTGIGLALVRRIVERHGGRIWADARPGEGATFRFTLPAARRLGPQAAAL